MSLSPAHRATASLALLVGLVGVQLADAVREGPLVSSAPLMLGTVLAGYVVGITTRPWVAAPVVILAAATLTWAFQIEDPEAYPVLDDFVFALLVVGAPALAGAALRLRAEQVRELDRVAALLTEQRAAQVRAAQLEERGRLEARLHHGFGEQVAGIVMRAESARDAEQADARAALAEVEDAARQSLDRLRAALRAVDDEAATPPPVPPAEEPRTESMVGLPDVALALACGLAVAVEAVVSPHARGPEVLNVVAGLAAGAALVVRRRRPLLAIATSFSATAVLAAWLTPPTLMVTPILVLLVCGYTVGAQLRGLGRVWGLLLLAVGLVSDYVLAEPGSRDPEGAGPTTVIVALAVALGLVGAGWAERAQRRRAGVAELERGLEVEVGLAVAEQRERLAGELHDTVAHAMTVICLQASAGQVEPDPQRVDTILATARAGLAALRTGLDNLEDSSELSVAALTAQARRAGLRPQVHVTGRLDDLTLDARRIAVRVAREAVTNAARYAPGAELVVEVEVGGQLRLLVRDRGAAADTSWRHGAGSGLRGLAQEAQRAGGELRWGAAGAGFEVELRVPLVEVLV